RNNQIADQPGTSSAKRKAEELFLGMNQRELQNGIVEREALDPEGDKVVELLRALPRVEAPKNFDFGVKAKIAGRVAPRRAGLVPILKVAAPLSLLFAVAGFGIFYGTLPTENRTLVAEAPAKTEVQTASPPAETAASLPAQTAPAPQIVPAPVSGPQRASIEPEKKASLRRATGPRTNLDGPRAGSVDRTLESANTIFPRGIEPTNSRNANLNSNAGGASIPLRDVFGIMGVRADFSDGAWTVRESAANSTARRAGVQPGDVLEAIGGQPLIQTTTFKGGFSARSIRVRRDGKTINLNLKN
ncbi:MAG: PDZ domain-containing protein, partial [Acidobacteriota bacterium]